MRTRSLLASALVVTLALSSCTKEEEERIVAVFESSQFVENDCSDYGSLMSPNGGVQPTSIYFINGTDENLKIQWINFVGELTVYNDNLKPNETHFQSTFLQHPWYITTMDNECVTIVTALRPAAGDTVRFTK